MSCPRVKGSRIFFYYVVAGANQGVEYLIDFGPHGLNFFIPLALRRHE